MNEYREGNITVQLPPRRRRAVEGDGDQVAQPRFEEITVKVITDQYGRRLTGVPPCAPKLGVVLLIRQSDTDPWQVIYLEDATSYTHGVAYATQYLGATEKPMDEQRGRPQLELRDGDKNYQLEVEFVREGENLLSFVGTREMVESV